LLIQKHRLKDAIQLPQIFHALASASIQHPTIAKFTIIATRMPMETLMLNLSHAMMVTSLIRMQPILCTADTQTINVASLSTVAQRRAREMLPLLILATANLLRCVSLTPIHWFSNVQQAQNQI